ncbi:pyrroline-5-carboxylate reductase family protein [Paracoccus laeviglucosivorans]|uniref:Pyrroline-5-carboxylate reductase n=1 Tax=Paracoccus laeviglucosivorans TaxID=1197861 RepID=A0A521F9B9_9RHOB|nr:pyrroline-5-carboxylate reductase dimerization domain-containing protein [Paracoccus laeviglucosivorans]SMO92758.1 pyrroline-5-carboxylate reductase [Paracoccus laeviglucosivorans]
MRVGIIGGTGWLGSALGQRLLAQGIVSPDDLILLNRSGPKESFHGHRVRWAQDASELAALADVIVVSVRPQDWPAVQFDASGKLVISFMAGIPFSDMTRVGGRVVRAMPNAAAEIGTSYSPFWAGPGVTDTDRGVVIRLLSAIGTTDELGNEEQIDLMTALPGSGAAYPALMAVAMARFMQAQGVAEDIAWPATEAAVCGGAAMLVGQTQKAESLLAAYLDYRGTTAAGIDAAEAAGFSAAITQALQAATEKTRRISAELPG